jgi:hypothetical protein
MELKLDSALTERAVIVFPQIWVETSKKKRFASCEMLLDTGAFMTTIDKRLADRNGYKRLKPDRIYDRETVKGIGGRIPCEYAIIPNMMIDGVELGSIYACVIDFADNFETSAILGFNFIREFKTTIDITRSEASVSITLEPKFDISDIHTGNRFNKLKSRFGLAYLQNEM